MVFMQAGSVEGASYSIAVDAGQQLGQWNRFYEQLISTDHAHDMLSSYYGRNMQNALRRGVNECGFKYFRGHGILNSDIGLYSEPNGVPTYNWSKFDSVYDAAQTIGIRPILEFSFTPTAMASGTNTCLWYNGAPGNTTMPKDLNKWRDLCDSVVTHCEGRYGQAEVRQWFFEVFNEPNLTFFAGSQQDYFKLYDYASEGVRNADSLCKIGGPATAGNDTVWISAFIKHVTGGSNLATGAIGSKCDFISYHRYASDPAAEPGDATGISIPQSESDYQKAIIRTCKNNNFSGLIINDEWGLSAYPIADRENERNASYIVKTIHLLMNNGAAYPAPFMYGFWCMSDIYEESNFWANGRVTAFDNPGNYGICLRGDASISDSWDVGKPAFNAFKLLHQMGDVQISCTGGIFGNGPNSFATISKDTSAVQIMIYTHMSAYNSDSITLTVKNIPFANARIEHFIVDSARSNSYRAWQGIGSPAAPNAAQWAQIKAAADLKYYDSVKTVAITGNSFTGSFSHRPYSVSLVKISDPTRNSAVKQPDAKINGFVNKIGAEIKSNNLFVSIPMQGQYEIALFNMKGALVFKTNAFGQKTTAISMPQLRKGTYVLRCSSGTSSLTTKVLFCR
jgi:Glycosyl hydrolases family 39.